MGGRSHLQIASRMRCKPSTVRSHFKSIYRKLGVSEVNQALEVAAARGYSEFTTETQGLCTARGTARGTGILAEIVASVCDVEGGISLRRLGPIAECGLLLLCLAGIGARQIDGDTNARVQDRGALCRLSPEGKIVWRRAPLQQEVVRHLAVAPPEAARRGFLPGRLYAAHDLHPQQGLSRGAITCFAAEGAACGSFCGGRDADTRLIGPLSLCFHPHGRLLATAGWLTDAVLAFDCAGAEVTRFAEGCYTQICFDRHGTLYGALYSQTGGVVKVLDHHGAPVLGLAHTFRATYLGVAVDSRGHAWVARETDRVKALQQVDDDGAVVCTHESPGWEPGILAVDGQDRLYALCAGARQRVHAAQPDLAASALSAAYGGWQRPGPGQRGCRTPRPA